MFKPGDRVARKADTDYRGTVRGVGTLRNVPVAFVRWDNGSITDVWQSALVRSPDDGPEDLKAMFRF